MSHVGNKLIDPQMLFEKVNLSPGMHAADLGCGRTGHIVFPGAMLVGEMGVIYAVDILKDVLKNINERAVLENMVNIHTVWSDLERVGKTSIPAKNLDAAFLINVLVQSTNRLAIMEEALRLLKDKAKLVVVDWAKNSLPFAPTTEKMVDFESIKNWARSRGLLLQEEFAAGPYHKGLIFFKQT